MDRFIRHQIKAVFDVYTLLLKQYKIFKFISSYKSVFEIELDGKMHKT